MFFKRLIKIIHHSFCSKEFYIDLYHNVKGLKLQYLITLIFITNLSFVTPLYFQAKNTVENNELLAKTDLNYIQKQLPESIAIKDHILEIPDHVSEVIYSENKQPTIGFATKNNLEKLKGKNVPLIITKYGTYILTDNQYIFISFALYMPKNSFISPQMVINQIRFVQQYLGFVFIIFYVISTAVKIFMTCFNILFFSGFGFLYMKIQKTSPEFSSIYRVSAFTALPSIIVEFILNTYIAITSHSITGLQQMINSPLKANIVFFIAVGYFYYALFHITKSYKKQPS